MWDYLERLPINLKESAYLALNGEAAWPRSEALKVVDFLAKHGMAVLGGEVWLPTTPGPTIPTPIIYTWEVDKRQKGESWSEFVQRASELTKAYLSQFEWDKVDVKHKDLTPYFNLTFCNEQEYPGTCTL